MEREPRPRGRAEAAREGVHAARRGRGCAAAALAPMGGGGVLRGEGVQPELIARVQAFEAALRALPESGELFAARPRSQRRAADGDEAAVAQRAAAVEQRQSADALEALRSKGVDVRV